MDSDFAVVQQPDLTSFQGCQAGRRLTGRYHLLRGGIEYTN